MGNPIGFNSLKSQAEAFVRRYLERADGDKDRKLNATEIGKLPSVLKTLVEESEFTHLPRTEHSVAFPKVVETEWVAHINELRGRGPYDGDTSPTERLVMMMMGVPDDAPVDPRKFERAPGFVRDWVVGLLQEEYGIVREDTLPEVWKQHRAAYASSFGTVSPSEGFFQARESLVQSRAPQGLRALAASVLNTHIEEVSVTEKVQEWTRKGGMKLLPPSSSEAPTHYTLEFETPEFSALGIRNAHLTVPVKRTDAPVQFSWNYLPA